MSRYTIPGDDHLERVVGWDAPLETFFAQLLDPTWPEDEDEVVWWIGTTPSEIPTVADLIARCHDAHHLHIPSALCNKLQEDKDQSTQPTPLQRAMLELLRP